MKKQKKHIDLKVTPSGFKYRLDPKRLGNYELIEAISEADENPLKMPVVIKLLLGEKQAQQLKDHCRDKDGFVSTEKLMEEVKEIFQSQQIKN